MSGPADAYYPLVIRFHDTGEVFGAKAPERIPDGRTFTILFVGFDEVRDKHIYNEVTWL